MLRPAPVAFCALLLAACAAPRPDVSDAPERGREPIDQPAERPERQPAGSTTHYLRGIEQTHVRPLSSVTSERLASDSSMREAMISGDAGLYVAAAAFVHDQQLGLDLIVVNHRQEAIQFHRKDLRLYDASGRALEPLHDFPGAEELGLRGSGELEPPAFLYEAPDSFGLDQDFSGSDSRGGVHKGRSNRGSSNRPRRVVHNDWRAMEGENRSHQAPATLNVQAESGRAWWAYWQSEGPIAYPVTAFVVFGDEQLMFQFEDTHDGVAR